MKTENTDTQSDYEKGRGRVQRLVSFFLPYTKGTVLGVKARRHKNGRVEAFSPRHRKLSPWVKVNPKLFLANVKLNRL